MIKVNQGCCDCKKCLEVCEHDKIIRLHEGVYAVTGECVECGECINICPLDCFYVV